MARPAAAIRLSAEEEKLNHLFSGVLVQHPPVPRVERSQFLPRRNGQAIDNFVQGYNDTAAPFEWTKTIVHPSVPKCSYANLC